jgi:hypothetical protein
MSNRTVVLWTGFLGGPIVWFTSFEARFAWAPWTCTFQTKWALHLIALAAFLVCAGLAALSWREWKALGAGGPSQSGTPLARSQFMAILGIVTSLGCAMVVVAQAIPEFVLGACQ